MSEITLTLFEQSDLARKITKVLRDKLPDPDPDDVWGDVRLVEDESYFTYHIGKMVLNHRDELHYSVDDILGSFFLELWMDRVSGHLQHHYSSIGATNARIRFYVGRDADQDGNGDWPCLTFTAHFCAPSKSDQ